jgi:hypothetical protein
LGFGKEAFSIQHSAKEKEKARTKVKAKGLCMELKVESGKEGRRQFCETDCVWA